MKKQLTIFGFLILVLIQLGVIYNVIYKEEQVINKGKAYKFLTQPIDPTDPFRGKFITLRYKMDSYKTAIDWKRGEDVYVYLKDSLGFAAIDTISKNSLDVKKDFVVAKATWSNNFNILKKNSVKKVHFKLPFNRFYMEEFKANPAEVLTQQRVGDSLVKNVYSLVYVNQGKAVLQDVFVNEIPIKDFVEKMNK